MWNFHIIFGNFCIFFSRTLWHMGGPRGVKKWYGHVGTFFWSKVYGLLGKTPYIYPRYQVWGVTELSFDFALYHPPYLMPPDDCNVVDTLNWICNHSSLTAELENHITDSSNGSKMLNHGRGASFTIWFQPFEITEASIASESPQ